MNFKGKVVIVTGAGKGLGRAISVAFAREGAVVVLAEIDTVTGKETESEINSSGGSAYFIRTDVRQPNEIVDLVKETFDRSGRIDILINNAGIGSNLVSPLDLPVEAWDNTINTNLRSVFLCTREVAKIMKQNGGGSVVNIASTRAFMSEPGWEAYAATKGGIVSLTHALAASMGSDKIRVNCISPGWIETGDYIKLKTEDHEQHFAGRVGKPEDIAEACLYLAGDGSGFITGANLIIDGGMTRKMIYTE